MAHDATKRNLVLPNSWSLVMSKIVFSISFSLLHGKFIVNWLCGHMIQMGRSINHVR